MRRPGHDVHGSRVQGEFEDFGPLPGLFAPDEHFAVVGGGGEDVAVFRVGLVAWGGGLDGWWRDGRGATDP